MRVLGLMVAALIFGGCNTKTVVSPEEARVLAKEAYIYGFPLVMNYKTMYNYTLNEDSPEYKGPINQKSCEARLFTPNDKAVVTPNSDTPYCMFWMDLRNEPQVFSLPEMEADRFYHFQFIDLYTHNFAYLGSLTTGNKAGKYLIANHGWEGEKPDGIDKVLYCETDLFFVVVRTQLMGANDLEKVKAIQEAYEVQGLSDYLGKDLVQINREDAVLEWRDGDEYTAASFTYLDYMLNLTTPVIPETDLLRRMAKLGLGTPEGFDLASFDEETQEAIEQGVKDGLEEVKRFLETNGKDPLVSAKIFGTRDFLSNSAKENYGLDNFYILRMAAAYTGLYGNSGSEAIYPAYLSEAPGVPFNAANNNYTLTFEQGQLPPVEAFWSLTIYDGKTQLFIENPLNRYLLNSSALDQYVFNEDGSLTLYIQKDSPDEDFNANWLPAPNGPFYCVLRLYGPKDEALSGEWKNPALLKTSSNEES